MILHKEADDFSKVFAHELNHAVLHHYCESTSDWLDEGLAELFEDIIFLDSAYYFGPTQLEKMQDARNVFMEGASITEAIHTRNFYETASSKNYTLSWAVMFYLYKTNPQILSKIIHGNCSRDFDNLFFNYPGGEELLEIDVKSFFLNYSPDRP
jgi:hypothetical protein